MIRALLTQEDFLEAIRKSGPIVITDKAGPARFHSSASSCDHVTFDGFSEKVLVNKGRNGGYFSVDNRAEAEDRWPSLSDCWGWT
jgi:hypothetical protein